MAIFFLYAVISALVFVDAASISKTTVCSNLTDSTSYFTLSYNGMNNSTGHWIDALTAQVILNKSSEPINVLASHKIDECDNKRIINIKGISQKQPISLETFTENEGIKGVMDETYKKQLLFHPVSENNSFITNGGRTVRRIAPGDYNNYVYTNRPLKDKEIFEVKLERKEDRGNPILIGVTSILPWFITGDYRTPMATWKYFKNQIHINDTFIQNYGKSTKEVKVGMTIGVMRTQSGDVHFFFDGIGQGKAFSNVPPNVYGTFSLAVDGERASIVTSNTF